MAQTDRAPNPEAGPQPRKVADFLAKARKRFDRAMREEAKNRQAAVEDLRFKQGDQWPESIRAQRTMDKRPCLTVNKMKTFVHQITNDQRQNRPAISVSPVGDKSDPHTAKMLRGLIRQIERQSNADVAYDTAFDSAVSIGWGYWRVITEEEDEDTFDQVLKIKRIRNPMRVYIDSDAEEPEASDAQWAFISDMIPRADFESRWPKADPMPWDQGALGDTMKNWSNETHVRVAEYFYFDTEERELVALENGHVGYEDELAEDVRAQIKANEGMVVKRRTVNARKLKWCTITAKEILDETEWKGKWIPIVRVIGDEVDVDGQVGFAGIIRDAKDPQRMYNFWCTAETELIALAPKAPWVMEEGQVEGHEKRWQEANTKSYPYLLYKGVNLGGKPAPPPQRQPFAGSPQGVVQAKVGAAQDMQAATGIRFDATLNERMYDESGKALRELKRTADIGNFHYIDNLARALKHTGRILIDLIPKIYDTPRVLTILREDDSEERVQIDPSLAQPHGERQMEDGKVRKLYNPRLGDYDVMVNIGPSYATKRAEAADSMLAFVKAYPPAGQIAGDLIAKNMDWPGAEEIAARMAALLPPQVQALMGKQMRDWPPEAKAMLMQMSGQLQGLNAEHQKALAMLGEKQSERALQKEKIDKDYDAKIAKIVADLEKTAMGIRADIGAQMADLGNAVKAMERSIANKQQADSRDMQSFLTNLYNKPQDGATRQ